MTLRAFEARMRPRIALVVSALVFGAVHLQLLQFPALVAIGLVCGWLAQRDGRIGRAIWAHVGFNGLTVALLLLEIPTG
ncbi:MAG TPA: CPBP family intramembrane metalloprotease [Acidimicrobiia bacterium]|nr:CPBP family intramembrane metalloprotease [Acidimicrobiia bacterium]